MLRKIGPEIRGRITRLPWRESRRTRIELCDCVRLIEREVPSDLLCHLSPFLLLSDKALITARCQQKLRCTVREVHEASWPLRTDRISSLKNFSFHMFAVSRVINDDSSCSSLVSTCSMEYTVSKPSVSTRSFLKQLFLKETNVWRWNVLYSIS